MDLGRLTVNAGLLECWNINYNVSTSSSLGFIHLIHQLTDLYNLLHLTIIIEDS